MDLRFPGVMSSSGPARALIGTLLPAVALLLIAGCGSSKTPSAQRVIRELKQSETVTKVQEEEAREHPLPRRYATKLEAVCLRFEGTLVRLNAVEPASRAYRAAIANSRHLSSRLLLEARRITPPASARAQATSLLDALEQESHKNIAFEEALGRHNLLAAEDRGVEEREAFRAYERKRSRSHLAACGF